MYTTNFSGLTTALITPFEKDRPDFTALEKILGKQISAKADAILLFGTTGEGLSLSLNEKKSIFLSAKHILDDKIPIITCISSPITHTAVEYLKEFEKWGSSAIMAITPFYYKCTQEGIVKHFSKLCENTQLPIIVYNVPTRTSYDIFSMPLVLDYFNACNQIVSIKQADNNLQSCLNSQNKTKKGLLCGNDKYIYECLNNGYNGVVSVISNLFPAEIKQIISLLNSNKKEEANKIFNSLTSILDALETLPNPITVKYAAKLLFGCNDDLRLPLTPPDQETKLKIIKEIIKYKENEWDHF